MAFLDPPGRRGSGPGPRPTPSTSILKARSRARGSSACMRLSSQMPAKVTARPPNIMALLLAGLADQLAAEDRRSRRGRTSGAVLREPAGWWAATPWPQLLERAAGRPPLLMNDMGGPGKPARLAVEKVRSLKSSSGRIGSEANRSLDDGRAQGPSAEPAKEADHDRRSPRVLVGRRRSAPGRSGTTVAMIQGPRR